MKKLFLIFALLAFVVSGFSQVATVTFKNSGFTNLNTDTVTNTGTGTISTITPTTSGNDEATIQVVCTEISGITAGTITLMGSLDNVNWVALTDATAVPQVGTKTATDVASQTFLWRLDANPCKYYRISWTGAGTMSATLSGTLITR